MSQRIVTLTCPKINIPRAYTLSLKALGLAGAKAANNAAEQLVALRSRRHRPIWRCVFWQDSILRVCEVRLVLDSALGFRA